jgi:phage major head subunit gpT-like protein
LESYDVVNEKYEATIEVDRDEISDDQTGQISLRVQEMAEKAVTHKDSEIARLLVNGHSAGHHSYDGVPFFNTLHASGESGNQDNTIPAAVAVDPKIPPRRNSVLPLGVPSPAYSPLRTIKADPGRRLPAA